MSGILSAQRAAENGRPAARKPSRSAESGRKAGAPGRRRVLVVEDNLDAVRSLALVLREMGHQVEYAINGYAGLEAAKRFNPEFVILDLGLPGMDGFEFCRRVKRDPELSSARVIALTGYSQEDYRRRSEEAGCEEHLLKPVDLDVLQRLLEQ